MDVTARPARRRSQRVRPVPLPAPARLGADRLAGPQDELAGMIRGPRRTGALAAATFAGFFAVWGGLAPLAGGAVAQGNVIPDGGVRTVQHLEGGIVRRFHVRDGDLVAAGAPLLDLESVGAKAEVEALTDRHLALLAERARLEAEMTEADAIAIPPELRGSPRGAAVAALERRTFEARRHMLAVRKRVLEQKVAQLAEEIAGFEAQVASAAAQIGLIEEELAAKETLLARGLTPKADVLRLRRAAAEIGGFRGEHLSRIAGARKEIGETELQLIALDAERAEEIATRSNEVRTEIAEVEQLLARSADVLQRTVIAAPVEGRVTNLRILTTGGVVRPGDAILDIVPARDVLRIDARVAPDDIDVVRVGAVVEVRLGAYAGRAAEPLEGRVIAVAPDASRDEATGATYYTTRVEVSEAELAKVGTDVRLVSGMTAEVVVVDETRTLVDYLTQPIRDVLFRSLRET